MKLRSLSLLIFFFSSVQVFSQFELGRLQYSGGDWYGNPSSLPNLLSFFSKKLGVNAGKRDKVISLKNESFKKVAVMYFTGHGIFKLNLRERNNLRWFLKNGGFLFADDNFGMDKSIRKVLNSLFPGIRLQEISWQHKIFKYPFKMPNGLPKIHKHYGGPAKAYGLFLNGRLVTFYGYNSDLGDGWEDVNIHNDGSAKHLSALQMGVNVLWYALNSGL